MNNCISSLRSLVRLLYLIAFCCCIASPLSASTKTASFPINLTEGKPAKLLNGHLELTIPKGAVLSQRAVNIMEPSIPEIRESRMALDAGKKRLVMLAEELFTTAGADFESRVRRFIESYRPVSGIKSLSVVGSTKEVGNLQRIEFTSELGPIGEANLIRGFLFRQPDGTLQLLTFYLNGPAMQDRASAIQLAELIVESSRGGVAAYMTGQLVMKWGSSSYSMPLPKDHVAYLEEGPDFSVYRINQFAPLGDKVASMGIYFGDAPERDDASKQAHIRKLTIFGGHQELKIWAVALGGENWFKADCRLHLPKNDGTWMDVFFFGPTEESVIRMAALLERLT